MHEAKGVDLGATLRWFGARGATTYRVYFGEDSTPDDGEFRKEQAGLTFSPGRLMPDTTYYWRVDAKNAGGTTTGAVWKFTTKPAKPDRVSGPTPSYDAKGVDLGATLRWLGARGATTYRVYFGEDSTPDGGEFRREQTGLAFSPGRLAANTTYYWRVDAKNAVGVTTGAAWKFTTKPGEARSSERSYSCARRKGRGSGSDAEMAWCERCDDVPSVPW